MRFILFATLMVSVLNASVELGIDRFFTEGFDASLEGKRVGLITNHTGINRRLETTVELFLEHAGKYTLNALFCPEHGLQGTHYAAEHVEGGEGPHQIPLFSLHGATRRPTEEMLSKVDLLVYDIQDVGCRSYTYASTLFYAMEEAAKKGIGVIVLDRPNPMGGVVIDGPLLDERWRSYLGYINVPYCHGMTIGELARFFNEEYKIGCKLDVIPMKGWKRTMAFADTGLVWVPTSPNIPEPDTPFYYASTGILGELGIVNIGVGYTLPFKVIGAPWIDAQKLVEHLRAQKLPGVDFIPFHYTPFFGSLRGKECHGVKIIITDPLSYRPLSVQYLLLGALKSLFPKQFKEAFEQTKAAQRALFSKVNGNGEMIEWVEREKYITWKLIQYQHSERERFRISRKKYLLY